MRPGAHGTTGRTLTLAARVLALTLAVVGWTTARADAQIGQLVSPGPLAKAHAALEGASNCQKCHAAGRKVTADLCLSCHKAVAERIRLKAGVHRSVQGECSGCHVEHAGVDGDLLHFNPKAFNHTTDTSFPLDGRHAPLAKDCATCHKTRSFLTASPVCSTCHADIHKPSLGADCRTCHPTDAAFKDARARFDHAKSAFPLTGAHRTVACAKCHINNVFKGVKFAQCTDCHKTPHRQPLGDSCSACHTTETWKTQKIDHAKTAYPLRGKHAELACVTCHIKPPVQARIRFDRCAACHQDPHRGAFKQDCSSCHNERAFGRGTFDHTTGTRFPLTGAHAPLACAKCHKGLTTAGAPASRVVDFRGLNTACSSCHADVHKAELGKACEACHTMSTFKVSTFTHTRFQEFFGGRHQGLTCAQCHVTRAPGAPMRTGVPIDGWTFKNVPTACASCHRDVHLGQVGSACEACHTLDAAKFAAVKFSHAKTAYPLTGRHESVDCRKCHKTETGTFPAGAGTAVRLKGVGTSCASCHKDLHLGQLGAACERCHTTATFKVPTYTHVQQATLITGRHSTLACSSCHKPETGTFPSGAGSAVRYKIGAACSSCHADAHGGSLGTTCENCHTPAMWRTINRAFHKSAAFPLEGRHLAVECASCHLNGQIKGTPTRCYDCHWIRRQDDPYQTRLGVDCERCHRPVSWTAVRFDHGAVAGVPLSAVHRTLGCDGCHKTRTFQPGQVTCYGCHAEEYQATRSPVHAAAGFPTSCEVCHRASHSSWSQAVFNHTAYFPLVGLHATQPCASCHKNNVYKGTPRVCVGCHKTDFDRTTSPNHVAAGFSTTCESCHRATDTSWKTTFNHASAFPLVGLHATQACTACHKNNVYAGTPRDCIGCHKTDYDRTTSPNHAAAGFSTTCDACHRATDTSWKTTFNHASVFPLVGVHATQACTACHKNNVYKGTPRDCIGCHRTNYDRTTSPNHAAAGFSTTCESCHSASASSWSASFDHNRYFVLAGRHLSAACSSCHQNSVYRGTPRECYPCHRTQYDGAANPNHRTAGFPTTCESCHRYTDTSWNQGRFDHTWFPITSGKHAGNACSACHQDSGNYRSFTCLTCHTRSKMDEEHKGRAGYRYESAACYSCHPTGRAG